MLRRRLMVFRLHFRGRAGAWLALVGQFCAIVGLPLPAASAKDLSKPFPCQHRACGCMKADDCWRTCCCFSAGARVAWAQEHDVVPPQELVAAAEHEGSGGVGNKPCCSPKKPAAQRNKTAAGEKSFRWLFTIGVRHCRGGAGEEGGPAPSCPPAAATSWDFEWLSLATFPTHIETPVRVALMPILPPPRASSL